MFENHPKYCVNRLSNLITINQDVATNFVALVVNLNEVALEVKVETMNFANLTQETVSKKNYCLYHLYLQEKPIVKKSVVNYSWSHFVTLKIILKHYETKRQLKKLEKTKRKKNKISKLEEL